MQQFLANAAPEPMAILGQRLEVLTIGHLIYLERFDCSPVQSSDQLITAVLICSQPVDQVIPTLEDRWLHVKLMVLRWRLGKNIIWQDKIDLWEKYLSANSKGPTAIPKTDSQGMPHSRTPFLQHLKTTLQAKLNYSPSEAFAAPFSQALWDYYTFHELEGNMEIADAEERQDMKAMADAQHADLVREALKNAHKRN